LSFARLMMHAFENRLALVGITTDNTHTGKWIEKEIDGVSYLFFSIGRRKGSARRPVIPERLSMSMDLMRYKKEILSLGIKDAFSQAPEILMVISRWRLDSICYRFPGVENPLAMPRYSWGKVFVNFFDRELFRALKKADVILASADETSIQGLVRRSNGQLPRERIIHFPTRVDTGIFYPKGKHVAREALKLPGESFIIVSCGRINRVKGWDLLLDSFFCFQKEFPRATLIFVGDGEERDLLNTRAVATGINGKVAVTGFQNPEMVAVYINAADLVVVGSHKEGWSIAMLEALACGKNVVTTDISGASDMILEGTNGFIVKGRTPEMFATAMKMAVGLPDPNETSIAISEKYALRNLRKDISTVWELLV
jgi:glycosyltransferase involved in cell wall biosynthesis